MEAKLTPIRIAIVGAGLIGPRHARTVIANHDANLVAVVDPSPTDQQLATELGVGYYPSLDDLLRSRDVNGVEAAVICTPNHTHVAIAKTLAAQNIHLLVEKPISTDVSSGRDLIGALGSSTSKILVGHHRRFNPFIVETKHVISQGILGKLLAVNGIWALHKPLDYFQAPAEWRKSDTGGVTLINMIHEVDLLHHLFGPIQRVHAEKIASQRGFDAEEGAAMTFKFRSGLVGTFLLSDFAPSPYNFESGSGENPLIPKSGQDFYRIFGSEGCLSVPDMLLWSYQGTEKSWHSELTREKLPVSDAVPFSLQLNHFINVIRGREAAQCTVQVGLAALIVCEAIKKALKSETTLEIEEYTL
ncbi:hypothetical protein QQS21_004186 [Conoideocrella luteorostrata]|uniref:Uncharacterized protein n=1 Tax=Conoideocrella luteorostrata TaxID=1105319 RepID=A0AAJ0CUT9_9HYPO|nr:hypothetical protein QQS21_004186 [Conoideocrella luteorostrata]